MLKVWCYGPCNRDYLLVVSDVLLGQAIEKPTMWGIFELPELPTFVEGRVALVGDAVGAGIYSSGFEFKSMCRPMR